MNDRPSTTEVLAFLIANVLVLGTIAFAWVVEATQPDFYYFSVQEDEYLEWASFWAFILAGIAFVRGGIVYRAATARFPWFLYGAGLFCFVVAMEEISWAQRLFGYRPPVYFLEHNYQQEFNFHNVIDTGYRKLALQAVIAGYGMVLPVAARFRATASWLTRAGVISPPVALLPVFAGTLALYVVYPWSHSGEWVEFMLGLGFLFSAMAASGLARSGGITLLAFVAVVSLGLVTGAVSRAQRDAHPENLAAARDEALAIAADFESGLAQSRCNLHKRLYTFVEQYGQDGLLRGGFAALQSQGLPAERAAYFLDPWNSPYWIRDRCDARGGKRFVFVYSFGPNRRRDSTPTELLGDDIGAFIVDD